MTIRASAKTFRELGEFIMSGVCGHRSPPLSAPARRVYGAMLRCKFQGQLVEVADSHPKELVWLKNGQTLEQAISQTEKQSPRRHNRKEKCK